MVGEHTLVYIKKESKRLKFYFATVRAPFYSIIICHKERDKSEAYPFQQK